MFLRNVFCSVLMLAASVSAQETERFDIARFQIDGATLIPASQLQALVLPFTGSKREFGDIQRALEAVEQVYRLRGFAAVQVYAPEQELTGGTVRLQVTEVKVAKVTLEAKPNYFDQANIRAGLPALREGKTPNAKELAAQIALNNESPAKQVEVLLGLGEQDDTVDAKIKLVEEDPVRFSATLDNTGSAQTGKHRLGLALQHANMMNRDHVLVLAYQTSPEKLSEVRIYSLSYRLPVYEWAGAFDAVVARSNVDAGVTSTTFGDLSFSGSGVVLGLRYTQALPRQGDTTHKATLGWDIKANDNSCSLGSFGAAGCGAAAVDLTLRPLSLAYSRMTVAAKQATAIGATLVANIGGGKNGRDADTQASRPAQQFGSPGARANYKLLRGAYTYSTVQPNNWQLRLIANGQWSPEALLPQEQLGMAGNSAVRGFQEREVARDSGLVVNLEAISPSLSAKFDVKGELNVLAFLDIGAGRNRLLDGETQPKSTLASVGVGLRYGLGKKVSGKLDLARVLLANGNQNRGDWFGHFNLVLSF